MISATIACVSLQGQTWASPIAEREIPAYLARYPNVRQTDPNDPTGSIRQVVGVMVELINHSLTDPIIGRSWGDACERYGRLAFGDPAKIAWWYAKLCIKFVHHSKLFHDWLGIDDALQLLISPEALLKMERPKGDCAIFTTLICALLSHAGVDWEIVTCCCNSQRPGIFSHVYPRAVRKNGRRLALDASHGKFPGWQVPQEHRWAQAIDGGPGTEIFNSQGQVIPDSEFEGLSGVSMGLGLGCACRRQGDGLGQDPGTGWDWGADAPVDVPIDYSGIANQIPSALPGAFPTSTMPGAPAGSGVSPQTVGLLSNLATMWTKIAGQTIAPQTTINTPQGLQIQTPAGQTANLPAILGGGTMSASIGSGSLLPLLLLGVAGVFVFKAVSH